ncbi:Capsid polyprotein VP90 [Trichinella pseudospiralis]
MLIYVEPLQKNISNGLVVKADVGLLYSVELPSGKCFLFFERRNLYPDKRSTPPPSVGARRYTLNCCAVIWELRISLSLCLWDKVKTFGDKKSVALCRMVGVDSAGDTDLILPIKGKNSIARLDKIGTWPLSYRQRHAGGDRHCQASFLCSVDE